MSKFPSVALETLDEIFEAICVYESRVRTEHGLVFLFLYLLYCSQGIVVARNSEKETSSAQVSDCPRVNSAI